MDVQESRTRSTFATTILIVGVLAVCIGAVFFPLFSTEGKGVSFLDLARQSNYGAASFPLLLALLTLGVLGRCTKRKVIFTLLGCATIVGVFFLLAPAANPMAISRQGAGVGLGFVALGWGLILAGSFLPLSFASHAGNQALPGGPSSSADKGKNQVPSVSSVTNILAFVLGIGLFVLWGVRLVTLTQMALLILSGAWLIVERESYVTAVNKSMVRLGLVLRVGFVLLWSLAVFLLTWPWHVFVSVFLLGLLVMMVIVAVIGVRRYAHFLPRLLVETFDIQEEGVPEVVKAFFHGQQICFADLGFSPWTSVKVDNSGSGWSYQQFWRQCEGETVAWAGVDSLGKPVGMGLTTDLDDGTQVETASSTTGQIFATPARIRMEWLFALENGKRLWRAHQARLIELSKAGLVPRPAQGDVPSRCIGAYEDGIKSSVAAGLWQALPGGNGYRLSYAAICTSILRLTPPFAWIWRASAARKTAARLAQLGV